jgi:hypothetical protein
MGSANARYRGRLKAPGSVLSAANTTTASLGRSSNSISAAAGPRPRTFPEKASFRRSCPAPYSPCRLATSAPARNASHARACTSGWPTPCRCDRMRHTSSPVCATYASTRSFPRSGKTRSRTTSRTSRLGRVCPPTLPMSALITLRVVRMLTPPFGYRDSPRPGTPHRDRACAGLYVGFRRAKVGFPARRSAGTLPASSLLSRGHPRALSAAFSRPDGFPEARR